MILLLLLGLIYVLGQASEVICLCVSALSFLPMPHIFNDSKNKFPLLDHRPLMMRGLQQYISVAQ